MAVLSAPQTKESDEQTEGRFRHTLNVVLLLAVVLDLAGQALHVISPGSTPLLILLGALAVSWAIGSLLHIGRR
jgi:hypothetical protein